MLPQLLSRVRRAPYVAHAKCVTRRYACAPVPQVSKAPGPGPAGVRQEGKEVEGQRESRAVHRHASRQLPAGNARPCPFRILFAPTARHRLTFSLCSAMTVMGALR